MDNHHHHHHDSTPHTLPFEEQMIKLLEHWIKHNDEHAESFRNWAEKARKKGLDETVPFLKEAAEMTLLIGKKFEAALMIIKKGCRKDKK